MSDDSPPRFQMFPLNDGPDRRDALRLAEVRAIAKVLLDMPPHMPFSAQATVREGFVCGWRSAVERILRAVEKGE